MDVERAINDANDDPRVHGIMVYYPIFGQEESYSGATRDDYLRDTVSYKCDVEGLCHTYRSNLYRNVRFLDYPANTLKCLSPCTSLSVVKILEQCPGVYDKTKPLGSHMVGKTVTVINRSETVGRPLAAMLANDGADVYSVDIDSICLFRDGRLEKCDDETPESCVRKVRCIASCRKFRFIFYKTNCLIYFYRTHVLPSLVWRLFLSQSSVVITGVPAKAYRLPTEWIQPNTTVVNVASFKNVDEESLLKVPGVVYAPLVGKVTVAMLERNLVRLFDNFHHPLRQKEKEGK